MRFLQEKTRKRLMYRHMIRIRSTKVGRGKTACRRCGGGSRFSRYHAGDRALYFLWMQKLKKAGVLGQSDADRKRAFTVCGNLQKLIVHLQFGSKSCVKEILGELWQRMDVTFVYENGAFGGQKAELVFPGIMKKQWRIRQPGFCIPSIMVRETITGSVFLAKELDYEKYDELFSMAVVMEKLPVLIDLCFGRLLFPSGFRQGEKQLIWDISGPIWKKSFHI